MTENEWQQTKPVPILLHRASNPFPNAKTKSQAWSSRPGYFSILDNFGQFQHSASALVFTQIFGLLLRPNRKRGFGHLLISNVQL
jgi:hypothetical protein